MEINNGDSDKSDKSITIHKKESINNENNMLTNLEIIHDKTINDVNNDINENQDLYNDELNAMKYYFKYYKENNVITTISKVHPFPPRIYKTAIQIFSRLNHHLLGKNNEQSLKEKWNQITEEERQIYRQKSDLDILRFDQEWKEYMQKYINLIYKRKKTKEEKENIVKNLMDLSSKYGRKYVYREISNLISIMVVYKSNKLEIFSTKKNKHVFHLKKTRRRK